jgi:hypothetical protein
MSYIYDFTSSGKKITRDIYLQYIIKGKTKNIFKQIDFKLLNITEKEALIIIEHLLRNFKNINDEIILDIIIQYNYLYQYYYQYYTDDYLLDNAIKIVFNNITEYNYYYDKMEKILIDLNINSTPQEKQIYCCQLEELILEIDNKNQKIISLVEDKIIEIESSMEININIDKFLDKMISIISKIENNMDLNQLKLIATDFCTLQVDIDLEHCLGSISTIERNEIMFNFDNYYNFIFQLITIIINKEKLQEELKLLVI